MMQGRSTIQSQSEQISYGLYPADTATCSHPILDIWVHISSDTNGDHGGGDHGNSDGDDSDDAGEGDGEGYSEGDSDGTEST